MRAITADLAQLKHREIEACAKRKARSWITWGGQGWHLRLTQDSLRENLTEEVEVFTLPIRKSLKDFARS